MDMRKPICIAETLSYKINNFDFIVISIFNTDLDRHGQRYWWFINTRSWYWSNTDRSYDRNTSNNDLHPPFTCNAQQVECLFD